MDPGLTEKEVCDSFNIKDSDLVINYKEAIKLIT